jgi:hypothetical protein
VKRDSEGTNDTEVGMFGWPTTIDGSADEPTPALFTAAMEMV